MESSSLGQSRYARLLGIMKERGSDARKECTSNDSLSSSVEDRDKPESQCRIVHREDNIGDGRKDNILGTQIDSPSSSVENKEKPEIHKRVVQRKDNILNVEMKQEQIKVPSSSKNLSNFSDTTTSYTDNGNTEGGEDSNCHVPSTYNTREDITHDTVSRCDELPTHQVMKEEAADIIFQDEVNCSPDHIYQNVQCAISRNGHSSAVINDNQVCCPDSRSIDELQNVSAKSNLSFLKARKQLKTFCQRIRACQYTQSLLPYQTKELDLLSELEVHANQLRLAASPSDLTGMVSSFSRTLQDNKDLSSLFLTNFLGYIQSVLDLEGDLTSLSEILKFLVPCVNSVLRGGIQDGMINIIKNDNLLPSIYNSLVATFSHEAKYSEASIRDLLTYQCGANKSTTIKAHVVRMSPQDSLTAFQNTFEVKGSHSDMYLIYVWHVFRIYEVTEKEGLGQPLVHSITELIEESGKYVNILRAKEIQDREKSDPFSCQPRDKPEALKLKDKATESPHPVPEANFEWADFRLGQAYANGVAFMVNSAAWVDHLREISADIEKLKVKKTLKSVPSLGSTLGLRLQNSINILDPQGSKTHTPSDVVYVRVRVVRTAGPIVCVYGVDTGTVHMCPAPHHLLLLPHSLIQLPPCGRLARLPVVPCPPSWLVAPPLALLVSLCHHPDLARDLCAIDVRPLASWLQVWELTQLTLHLLETLVDALPTSHILSQVSLITADYLLRRTIHVTSTTCINLAAAILTTTMASSPKIRLLLAREGIFAALCEMALSSDNCRQVWESIVELLGGQEQVEKWAALTHRAQDVRIKRNHKVPKTVSHQAKSQDSSLPVVCLASMMAPDRNWDLEVRRTLTTRQLMPYQSRTGWQWQEGEVVVSNMGWVHYGHLLNVCTDQTHHIILDKNVPNIRMNTLLQIILGMLNSGLCGKVYIGLSEAGIVQGVKMTRNQRDCFRLGFSKLVTSEITPSLLPCDSLIQIVPVLRPHRSSPLTRASFIPVSHSSDSESFIIVLTVCPQPGLVYHCRDDPAPVVSRGEIGTTVTLRGATLARTLAHAQECTQLRQRTVAGEKESLLRATMQVKSNNVVSR